MQAVREQSVRHTKMKASGLPAKDIHPDDSRWQVDSTEMPSVGKLVRKMVHPPKVIK